MTTTLATRVFDSGDQEAFAAASGDRNPLHLDANHARRTEAGAPVVHGVHLALWALEVLVRAAPAAPLGIVRAQFRRFTFLDEPVALVARQGANSAQELELSMGGLVTTRLRVSPLEGARPLASPGAEFAPTRPDLRARDLLVSEMDGAAGRLAAPADADRRLMAMFPALSARWGVETVSGIALLSALVGMTCPGLHSIFSEFTARLWPVDTAQTSGLAWAARRPDARYNRIELEVAGRGLTAQAKALVRAPPIGCPSMAELSAKVVVGEFSGRRVLVIGGSRGLGAASAKLLAAGGAKVVLTYAAGRDEAAAVVADIVTAGGVAAGSMIEFDARDPLTPQMAVEIARASHIYYFATPKIMRQKVDAYDPHLFAEFAEIFVNSFARIAEAAAQGGPRWLLQPSSVAITARPRGMAEYAMAKAAMEVLCEDLRRSHPALTLVTPRLARVLTDQTAIALPVRALSAVDAMLPILRA